MRDKEKISFVYSYLLDNEFKYKNEMTEKFDNLRSHADTFDVLEFYKAKCRYELFKELSSDIEKIISDIDY